MIINTKLPTEFTSTTILELIPYPFTYNFNFFASVISFWGYPFPIHFQIPDSIMFHPSCTGIPTERFPFPMKPTPQVFDPKHTPKPHCRTGIFMDLKFYIPTWFFKVSFLEVLNWFFVHKYFEKKKHVHGGQWTLHSMV